MKSTDKHEINRQVLSTIVARHKIGLGSDIMDVVNATGCGRMAVRKSMMDFNNAGDIYEVGGKFFPLIGDEVYDENKLISKFRPGDILLHKLTRERLLVLTVDVAHADEPLYEVRTNGYKAVTLRESELLPYNEEDERAPLPGEQRVPVQASEPVTFLKAVNASMLRPVVPNAALTVTFP